MIFECQADAIHFYIDIPTTHIFYELTDYCIVEVVDVNPLNAFTDILLLLLFKG